MKDKILMLVIGILLGAVITAGCFLLFGNKANSNSKTDNFGGRGQMMGNFTPGEMPQGMSNGNETTAPQTMDSSTTTNTQSNS